MTDSTFPRNRSWTTERRRLAMELHDNLGQRLALLAAEIGVLRQQLAKGATTPEATISVAYQTAGRLADHTADIGFEVHRISHGLRRTSLDPPELTAALERLCRDMAHAHGIVIQADCSTGSFQPPAAIAICLYRVAQEGLHNVVKHSHATTVTMQISRDAAAIVLMIVDDGQGFDVRATSTGHGLRNLRERVQRLGGTLEIRSAHGAGTSLTVRFSLLGTRHAPARHKSQLTRTGAVRK